MSLIYQASISPTKDELLNAWVPSQPWFEGAAGASLARVAAYRFDDPDGEVGLETFLLRAGDGPILQVPLTYRGAPLAGGEPWLVTTMEHSVLGPRWVYDAVGDPVYRAVLAETVLTGGREADQYVQTDDGPTLREPTAWARGSGSDAQAPVGDARIDLVRLPDTDAPDLAAVPAGARTETLTGTWLDQGVRSAPRLLARVQA